jgi:hypothetical protein
MWSRTFLGHYGVVDQALWSQTRMKPLESERVAVNVSWRDSFVRLAYYHVVDSMLHIFCLRYFWSFDDGRPYTTCVNNEEIVPVLFVVLITVSTWARFLIREIKDRTWEGDREQWRNRSCEISVVKWKWRSNTALASTY